MKNPSPDLWLLREVLVRDWCAHELWRILCCRVIIQSHSDPRAAHVRNLYGGTEIVSWHSSRPTAQVCSSNEDVLFPSFQSGHSGPHWTQCTTRASTCRTSSTPMQGWLDFFHTNFAPHAALQKCYLCETNLLGSHFRLIDYRGISD